MIVFDGQITGECLKKYKKICRIESLVVFAGLFVSWCVVNIISMSISKYVYFSLIIISTCILLVLPFCIIKLHYRHRHFDKICINVEDDRLVLTKGKKQKFIKINDIDQVQDMKEYYLFLEDEIILCQKSLLVEGTIEEFETIFKGKIIKK